MDLVLGTSGRLGFGVLIFLIVYALLCQPAGGGARARKWPLPAKKTGTVALVLYINQTFSYRPLPAPAK